MGVADGLAHGPGAPPPPPGAARARPGQARRLARSQGRREASVAGVAQSVLLPAALAGAILSALVRNGRALVNRPLLRPDLTQQW